MIGKNNHLDNQHVIANWTAGTAHIQVLGNRAAMGAAAATAIAEQIRMVAGRKNDVRMVFAAAPSQSDVLETLTTTPGIPWKQVTAFHMDDYVGLPIDDPARFSNWLEEHLFSKVSMGTVHRIPGAGEPTDICRSYSDKLAEAPIDIVCLGIGVNGHIAFNDPPVADFEDPHSVKIVALDEVCRQQQVDDDCFDTIDEVPTHAITLTVPRLIDADAIFCVVPGAHKRHAVNAAFAGAVSTECPASILTTHPNCTVFLDPEANPNG